MVPMGSPGESQTLLALQFILHIEVNVSLLVFQENWFFFCVSPLVDHVELVKHANDVDNYNKDRPNTWKGGHSE